MSKRPRRYSRRLEEPSGSEWYLVSSQGAALFYVAAHPDCTVEELARQLHVSRSTAHKLLGTLSRASMLSAWRDGRRNRYRVNSDAQALLPGLDAISLGLILDGVSPADRDWPLDPGPAR